MAKVDYIYTATCCTHCYSGLHVFTQITLWLPIATLGYMRLHWVILILLTKLLAPTGNRTAACIHLLDDGGQLSSVI